MSDRITMTGSNATAYRGGEIVTVTIAQGRVREVTADGYLGVEAGSGDPTTKPLLYLDLSSHRISVRRVTPADGVPRAGDLWIDAHGSVWFVHDGGPDVSMVPAVAATAGSGLSAWSRLHAGRRGPITLFWRPDPRQLSSLGGADEDEPGLDRDVLT